MDISYRIALLAEQNIGDEKLAHSAPETVNSNSN